MYTSHFYNFRITNFLPLIFFVTTLVRVQFFWYLIRHHIRYSRDSSFIKTLHADQ